MIHQLTIVQKIDKKIDKKLNHRSIVFNELKKFFTMYKTKKIGFYQQDKRFEMWHSFFIAHKKDLRWQGPNKTIIPICIYNCCVLDFKRKMFVLFLSIWWAKSLLMFPFNLYSISFSPLDDGFLWVPLDKISHFPVENAFIILSFWG